MKNKKVKLTNGILERWENGKVLQMEDAELQGWRHHTTHNTERVILREQIQPVLSSHILPTIFVLSHGMWRDKEARDLCGR